VLIPAEFLINHRSILWDDTARVVTIYHLELDTHDVLLANGAPAESYRDYGNRWLFQNANTGWDLPPKTPCAPVLTGGQIVDAVWRRLLDRSGPLPGIPLTEDPDLHVLAGGRLIKGGRTAEAVYLFDLPARPGGGMGPVPFARTSRPCGLPAFDPAADGPGRARHQQLLHASTWQSLRPGRHCVVGR
jgi:hypothetical protein